MDRVDVNGNDYALVCLHSRTIPLVEECPHGMRSHTGEAFSQANPGTGPCLSTVPMMQSVVVLREPIDCPGIYKALYRLDEIIHKAWDERFYDGRNPRFQSQSMPPTNYDLF